MNRYLTKLAKMDVKKYFSHVTGKASKDAATKVENLEDVIKNKLSLKTLKRRQQFTDKETTRYRKNTAVAAGGVAATAAGGYAYKRHKQNQETRAQMAQFYKSAGTASGAAKTLGRESISGVGRLLKRVGHHVGEALNTANGGKIKDYASRSGMKHGSKEYKAFSKSNEKDSVKIMMDHKKKTDKSLGRHNYNDTANEVKRQRRNLENQKTHARIALGATTVAGVSAYGHHKARQALKEKENYYR